MQTPRRDDPSGDHSDASSHTECDLHWNQLLANCLERLEKGEFVDIEQIECPAHLRSELADFLDAHQYLTAQWAPHHDLQQACAGRNASASPLDSHFTLRPENSLFGPYTLLREIDRGGMGVVFLARHNTLQRLVAVKMIKSGHLAGTDELRRFSTEAKLAAALDHPGIVPVFDVGENHGVHFYVMAYVEGGTLARCREESPPSSWHAAQITWKLAQAIDYAHRQGVVHRDLKPANVLLDMAGTPRIMDFGLAKHLQQETQVTHAGQILGTPAYMAPEQVSGQAAPATALDIYGLGAILYFLLTGQAPHQADSPWQVLLRVLETEPVPPRKLLPHIPRALEQICLKCLEKQPTARYLTAADLADDLRRFLQREPVQAGRASIYRRLRLWCRHQPALAAHLAGLLPTLGIVQIVHVLYGTDFSYYLAHTVSLVVWILVSCVLQRWLHRQPWDAGLRYAWAICDVLFMTMIIALAHGPRGNLCIGYGVLIVASGMFTRERFVWTTTVLSLFGYLSLVGMSAIGWLDDELLQQSHYNLMHLAALGVIGTLVAAQVRRLHSLSRYYHRD